MLVLLVNYIFSYWSKFILKTKIKKVDVKIITKRNRKEQHQTYSNNGYLVKLFIQFFLL